MNNTENKIIELPKASVEVKPAEPQRLAIAEAIRLGGAYARLAELSASNIVDAAINAERRGLEAYIAETLQVYGPELLGLYFIVRQEYEPFIQSAARVFNRIRPLPEAVSPLAPSATTIAK